MGLITFSTNSLSPRPGINVGETIVDISSIGEVSHQPKTEYLEELRSLESTVRDRIKEDSQAVDSYAVDDVTFHRPFKPEKIIRLEGCYEHDLTDEGFNPFIETDGLNEMDWPSHVAVPASSTVPPSEPIILPQFAEKIRPGVILGFVVGRSGKYLSSGDALNVIAGCLLAGDVALYDDLPGLFGYKSFDSALPLGPEVVPLGGDDLDDLSLSMAINGTTLDTKTTANWRFDPGELVASVSELMTLEPGDVVLTGNPIRTSRFLEDGDKFSATIEGIGTARWLVERESTEVGMRI